MKEASLAPSAEAQREEEASRLRARWPAGAMLVALAGEGKAWGSDELAGKLEAWRLAARPVALLIGGSNGLAPGLIRESDVAWILGPLTLPHELARVIVAEQLYRAFTILRGEPYHKGR